MAMPTVVASNLTGGTILLTRLGLTVPSSGTLALTDFATVREIREDESLEAAIAAGNMLLNLGGGDLTLGDSLKFFDIQTLESRISVRGMSDSNIASLSGTMTVDTTVALAVNDRVLLTGQTAAAQNGIWIVQAGAWLRPQDFRIGRSAAAAKVFVQEGTSHAGEMWACTALSGSDVVGTDGLAFDQVSGATSLQAAYEGGNTINATTAEGDIAFTLTSANFAVDGPGDILLGQGVTLGNVNTDARSILLNAAEDSSLALSANNVADQTLTIAALNSGAGNGTISMVSDGETTLSAGTLVSINSAGSINIGDDADTSPINIGTGTAARDITLGNKTGATSLTLESGTGNTLIDSPQVTMTGNLVVQGTTTTVASEIVNVADNFLYLNDGYTTVSALDGGVIVNSLPTATTDTVAAGGFTAGVAGTSNPTIATTGAATFAAGDFIQVSGANDQTNDGVYEVVSHAANVLTVAGVGTTGPTWQWSQNQFTADATAQGTVTKITLGAIQVEGSTGNLQYGHGSTTGITMGNVVVTDSGSDPVLSLQAAYDGGNDITTAGGTDVVVSGTNGLQITGAGGLNVDTLADFDVTLFDVLMTGDNGFSIDGTASSNLTATNTVASTDLTLTLEAANTGAAAGDALLDLNATSTNGTGAIELDADDRIGLNVLSGGAINIGTDAAASTTTIGNGTGATGVVVNSGTEKVEVDGVTYYGSSAGAPAATASGFQEGDKFYDTALGMEMRYDATRAKWLSVEAMVLQFGRNGNVGAGVYYRGINGRVMSSTLGHIMPHAGTVVGLGYTRSDTDAATFEVVEGGTIRATLASGAASGVSVTLDGDVSQNGILAIRNASSGNTTSNVMGWVKVRFRSV